FRITDVPVLLLVPEGCTQEYIATDVVHGRVGVAVTQGRTRGGHDRRIVTKHVVDATTEAEAFAQVVVERQIKILLGVDLAVDCRLDVLAQLVVRAGVVAPGRGEREIPGRTPGRQHAMTVFRGRGLTGTCVVACAIDRIGTREGLRLELVQAGSGVVAPQRAHAAETDIGQAHVIAGLNVETLGLEAGDVDLRIGEANARRTGVERAAVVALHQITEGRIAGCEAL